MDGCAAVDQRQLRDEFFAVVLGFGGLERASAFFAESTVAPGLIANFAVSQ